MQIWLDPWGRLRTDPRYESARKPAECPKCDSRRMAFIQYGLPMYDDRMKKAIAEGRIVLGGCEVTDQHPYWRCADCGTDVWKKK